MKLVASLFCVAALSLAGCVDQETTGGGQLAGMRPAKPSIDDPGNLPTGANPTIFEGMNYKSTISIPDVDADGMYGHLGGMNEPAVPAPHVCESCEVTAIKLPAQQNGIDEVHLVKDGETEVCRIYLNDNDVVINECFSSEP